MHEDSDVVVASGDDDVVVNVDKYDNDDIDVGVNDMNEYKLRMMMCIKIVMSLLPVVMMMSL